MKTKRILSALIAGTIAMSAVSFSAFAAAEPVEPVAPEELIAVDDTESNEIAAMSAEDSWIENANTAWYNDTDTEFTLTSAEQLAGLAQLVNAGNNFSGKTIKLGNDIDLAGKNWTPIGKSGKEFQGIFDGGSFTISNLKINSGESDVGLFGFTMNGSISNIIVNNAEVKGYLDVGAIAGTPYTSTWNNIKLTGDVKIDGYAYVGGLFGKNLYANADNLTIDASKGSYVKADSEYYRTYVGGIVGFMGEGGHKVSNVKSNIDVYGTTCDVGGITGIAHYNNTFENCLCTGDVYITSYRDEGDQLEIGGIAGVWHNENNTTVTFKYCDFEGSVSATNIYGVKYEGEFENDGVIGRAYSTAGTGKLIIINYVAQCGENKYLSLEEALEAANNGDTITLLDDCDISSVIEITENITIDGQNHTIDSSANRILWVDASDITLNLKNLSMTTTSKTAERGIQVNPDCTNVNINIENCNVTSTYYTINITNGASATINAVDSVFTGWGAFNGWSAGYTATFDRCTLNGINNKPYNAEGWNGFGTVVLEGDTTNQTTQGASNNTVNLNDCIITATQTTGNLQKAILFNSHSNGNIVNITGNSTIVTYESDLFCVDNGTDNVLKVTGGTYSSDVSEYIAEGYAQTQISDGETTLYQVLPIAATVNGIGYATFDDAVEAADDGDTVYLCKDFDDVDIMLSKYITIITNGKKLPNVTLPDKTYLKNNGAGIYTVTDSSATVIDTDKTASYTITLDNLKNNVGEHVGDAVYSLALETASKTGIDAISEKINSTEGYAPNEVQPVDIKVYKTVDGAAEDITSRVTNQPVTIKLQNTPKADSVKVYHYNGENVTVLEGDDLTVDYTEKTVSFTAPSFSDWAVAYDIDSTTLTSTSNVGLLFEESGEVDTYNIVLRPEDDIDTIYRFMSADLTFALDSETLSYEITPAANVNLIDNGNDRYEFNLNGTGSSGITGNAITIGKVKFSGIGTGSFRVAAAETNVVNTAKLGTVDDSIVVHYVADGATVYTLKLNEDATNNIDKGDGNGKGTIDNITLTAEKKPLTINVAFPNNAANNGKAYQAMSVKIGGGDIAEQTIELGNDNISGNFTAADGTIGRYDVSYTGADSGNPAYYTVTITDGLTKNVTYNVTVTGAGYRTARYTVNMNTVAGKTLNFWNNVKDDENSRIEEGMNAGQGKTNFLAGEIVKDNNINIYDLSAVVSYFGSAATVDNGYAKYDLNRDGKIDSKDVAYVLVSWGN